MKILQFKDQKFAFDKVGVGKPLILLHGHGLNHEIWYPMAEILSKNFTLILPDLRGHGQSTLPSPISQMDSMAEDVARLMDELQIEKIFLGGHSLGGYVALAFADHFPDRLLGLALITTNANADTPEKIQDRLDTVEKIKHFGSKVVADTLSPRLSNDQSIIQSSYELILASNPDGLSAAALGMAGRPDRLVVLKDLTCPILVIAGSEDKITPISSSQLMASASPFAHLEEISGAGHMPMLECPQTLASILIKTFNL